MEEVKYNECDHKKFVADKDKIKIKGSVEVLAVYDDVAEKNIKTNGDVIRSMSDEQLAYLFASIEMPDEDMMIICGKDFFAEDEILSWLKGNAERAVGCMGADSVAVLEEREKESDVLEGQMEISDYPGIIPEEGEVNEKKYL